MSPSYNSIEEEAQKAAAARLRPRGYHLVGARAELHATSHYAGDGLQQPVKRPDEGLAVR